MIGVCHKTHEGVKIALSPEGYMSISPEGYMSIALYTTPSRKIIEVVISLQNRAINTVINTRTILIYTFRIFGCEFNLFLL